MQPATALAIILKMLAPFVDDQTVAIVRVDVTRMNVEAFAAKVADLVKSEDGDPGVAKAFGPTAQWVRDFTEAGGREVFFIVSTSDLLNAPPYAVVPLYPGAKAERLAELVTFPPPSTQPGRVDTRPAIPFGEMSQRVGVALVCGRRDQIDRVCAAKAAERPELAEALAAAGEAAVQALLLPTADSRRVFEEMLPQLPPLLGGGSSTLLTRGVQWAALGIDLPPKMAVRLVVRSKDAAAAKTLHEYMPKLVGGLLAAAAKTAEGQPPEERPRFEPLARALAPALEGDRLTLSLDDRQVNDLIVQVLGPVVKYNRERARQAMSASIMRAIGMAIFQYESKHESEWPPDLDALVKDGLIDRPSLANPRRPDLAVGYVYLRPKVSSRKIAPDTLILHEAYTTWDKGINCGFADCHVEFIRDEATFKRLLAAAQAAPATAPGR